MVTVRDERPRPIPSAGSRTTRGRRTGRAARHPAPATGPWESGPKRCSSPGVDSVCSDNRFGARLAVGHLLEPPTNAQTAPGVLDPFPPPVLAPAAAGPVSGAATAP